MLLCHQLSTDTYLADSLYGMHFGWALLLLSASMKRLELLTVLLESLLSLSTAFGPSTSP